MSVESPSRERLPAHAEASSQAERAPEVWRKTARLNAQFDPQLWLELQCDVIEDAYAALLVTGSTSGVFKPVALWPENNRAVELLTDLVEQVIEQGDGLVSELPVKPGVDLTHYAVAHPVRLRQQVVGVIAVAVVVKSESELAAVMRELQWGAAWIELFETRERFDQRESGFKQLSTSVDLLARVLPESGFDSAAMRLVTELAINLNSDLVSIGFLEGTGIKLAHLSHSAEFGSQMNLMRCLENAMDETLDQRSTIVWPALETAPANLVTVAHRALVDLQENQCVMSVPLQVAGEWVGVITLQRDVDQPFTAAEQYYCESIVGLAATALEDKRHNDRPLWRKVLEAAQTQVVRFTGPGYVGRKVAAVAVAAVVLFFSVWQADYRLSADAILQATSQRVVVAPFDGYIKDAHVRAGDVVQGGEPLVSLDDRDLLLEQLKWRSQRNKLERQYQEAIASHDRSRITILDAQLEQAKAQLNLVDSQLQRSVQRAPFTGLVVSGDLSQRLGGTVSLGETLFELSPLNTYRVKLLVKESRIADLQPGQEGVLYLSALPERAFPFAVDKMTPVTEFEDGSTFFVVEGLLHETHDELRPGMEGVGKVSIDRRNMFAIWTRELREWMQLSLWRFWG